MRAHAAQRGWGIEDSAARLRIQTIDAFNGYLANSAAHHVAERFRARRIADAPDDLYAIAARETLRARGESIPSCARISSSSCGASMTAGGGSSR